MIERLESFEEPDSVESWKTVDDVVMGGRSSSRVSWIEAPDDASRRGWLRFEGDVSLENNGGFCSTRQTEGERDCPGLQSIRLLARGDARGYQWTIRTEQTPSGASWRHPFSVGDDWERLELSLDDFELWRRGRRLSADTPLEPASIVAHGILIADGAAGPFQLDVAEVGGRLSPDVND
jgi:hypothetical protein